VTLAIALAIRLDTPGPIFYKQARVGRNGRMFRCYKFRSMVANADELRDQFAELNESTGPLFKIRNDPRMTRVGRLIRRYSLDELPQLINVLRGEMSLIGPRPNLPSEVEQYQEWMKKRLVVSPGITGLWQVSGRSDLTFDEMVLLDIYYVENWSLGLDVSILLRSVPAVIQCARRLLIPFSCHATTHLDLLMMSDTGGGHRASAQALKAGYEELYPGRFQIDIVDVITDYLPYPLNQIPKTYPFLSNDAPWMWKALYNSQDPLSLATP
jgi:lipopolysaccharide/colanic/teichoic acid biosynthesis glycosyltransferase